MALDYYQILQIEPSADLTETKAAYRRLAHHYHPDKNPDNQSAQAYFALIKEAYETLSNPGKKEKYLQERWLVKANAGSFERPANTPEQILKTVLSASAQMSRLDVYRLNKEGIISELDHLLSAENLTTLNDFNELSVNDAIVRELIATATQLPTPVQIHLLKSLQRINSTYSETLKTKLQESESRIFWETWKPAFVILLVILICILIWGTSLK